MISLHTKFVVTIIDREYVNEAGISFPQTAIVKVYDKEENTIYSNDYGYLDTGKIYDIIDKDVSVNLDNCYVRNFSMTAYRRTRILHKKQIVKIKGFSAKEAIFDSNYVIDFSYTDFGQDEVNFQDAYFAKGDVNFHRTFFGSTTVSFNSAVFRSKLVDFSYAKHEEGDFIFRNAIFSDGEKNFSDVRFGEGNTSFSNVQFANGNVSFVNCRFNNGKTSFKQSVFGEGNIDFKFSSFGDGFVSFEKTQFGKGNCSFKQIQMGNGKTNFNKSRFSDGDINFDGLLKSGGKFNIMWVDFGRGNISFERAEMPTVPVAFDKANFDRGSISRVTFNRSKMKSLSLRSCHLDDYFDLRLTQCEYLDLSNTLVRDIVDLKCYDYPINIDVLNIAHMRLIGTIDIDWNDNNLKEIILAQEEYYEKILRENKKNTVVERFKPTNHLFAEQFRVLKENFNKSGRYEDEDKAYVMFKRFEQKATLENKLTKTKFQAFVARISYILKMLILDKMGQYATNPTRVMISMIVLYMFFSFLYVFLSQIGQGDILFSLGGENSHINIFSRSFYFSAISFLTIGYGDYYPTGLLKILSSIEGFVGLFLMSYFTVAFVRKILR